MKHRWFWFLSNHEAEAEMMISEKLVVAEWYQPGVGKSVCMSWGEVNSGTWQHNF